MNRKHELDALIDQTAAQIRADLPQEEVVRQAASRVWQSLAGDSLQAAAEAAMVEQIRGCADYQRLIPAYLVGQLPAARKLLLEDHSRECLSCRRVLKAARQGEPLQEKPSTGSRVTGSRMTGSRMIGSRMIGSRPALAWALAAMLVAGLGTAQFFWGSWGGAGAAVQLVEGQLFQVAATANLPVQPGEEIEAGRVLRTGRDSGAVVKLRDGSLIELKERSEIALHSNRKGTTIDLERGSVIVQAAKQRQRHLYVSTNDCLVAVTGTIFSVNRGTKGSRVAVIEGEVRVQHGGEETVLLPGEQVATQRNMGPVPLAREIAWSRDVDRYLSLLQEFSELRRALSEQVPHPELRYDSRLLRLLPADTVFVAAVPNLGATVSTAYEVIRQRVAASPALSAWWESHGAAELSPMLDETVSKLGRFAQFMGAEMVIGARQPGARQPVARQPGARQPGARQPGGEIRNVAPVVLAEVRDAAGLAAFLAQELNLGALSEGELQLVVVDDPLQPPTTRGPAIYLWLRSDLLVAAPQLEPLQDVARLLQAGQESPFAATEFYQQIAALYADGAGILVAVDLDPVVAQLQPPATAGSETGLNLERAGLHTLKHLMIEHKRVGDNSEDRAALTFRGERQGLASWLAAPAPMGGLDFVSPDAKLLAAVVFKDPVKMLDDLDRLLGPDAARFGAGLNAFEERHGLSLRDDFAAVLGGELTFAIDGPLLPAPSWKLIAEVYDPARFQWTVETALAEVNAGRIAEGQPAIQLTQQEVSGQTFYQVSLAGFAAHYTYVEGYLVVAPSRALLDRAIRVHESGFAFKDAAKFTALLPHDGRNNFSALLYQDLGDVLQVVAQRVGQGTLSQEQQQALDALAAENPTTLGYAYGEDDRIILAANSRGDLLSALLLQLLGIGGADPSGSRGNPAVNPAVNPAEVLAGVQLAQP